MGLGDVKALCAYTILQDIFSMVFGAREEIYTESFSTQLSKDHYVNEVWSSLRTKWLVTNRLTASGTRPES